MGKRYRIQDGSAFFITTTANDFRIISHSEVDYKLILDSLKFCVEKYEIFLIAFVIMPNHLHLIVWRDSNWDMSGFMRDLKRFTSVQIRKRLVSLGMDEPFVSGRSKSVRSKYAIWQSRFDTVPIRNEQLLRTKIEYIHYNPVKSGLVKFSEDWKWSSARYYNCEEDVGVPITWIF